ncbi:ATP-dependent RNA helicase HrpA [Knoellia locipacati]|uniref:ATP-dependent helicase n=1 Tax=Knoellia locipacati TaxID=882824 RepID=A0A512T536_9MICO|nr:ATP-dependent RNA helicase HrpA [Knoellia locipacati]GEQ15191.1 ATP-dependent helicase [Knoellia locipacati]
MPEPGSVVTDRGPVDPAQLRYPEQLPVVERRDDILAAIRDHQVVVIAGETGSGKTTQLPKMCLELGLGGGGQIGHTQPRRIAARSVAERIAEEMEVELGDLVGYQVRFTDHSSDRTRVKVMTDGILLAEMQRDRDLRRYDTIIIDEAHERSLNIDFILGYLKSLLPRRPDLKVVITSATIDPARFAEHFATDVHGKVVREVPVIEVSGRTYPVEIRYRPLVERAEGGHVVEERDQVTAVCDAVTELWTETPPGHTATDILVFFSGEREIRDAADALTALGLPSTEILPLYARLSAAEQHRVFTRGKGRRIILATNVAETSLTVPGIGYVIDTGTARISRYSQRTKVQRLPIEPISQASAAQRSGRCGRVADGIAIRLYSQEDFDNRAEFTEPEIQRTSLAAVILQMTSLGLGDIARFPFVDAPDPKQIADGVRLLEELRALRDGQGRRGERRLTADGKTLARLPLDPRMGRMIIEAGRLGCTKEVLVIVAALSIQDPRERPVDKEAQAQQQHARFKSETSDFAGFHALWRYLKEQQKALSGSAFRRMCKAEFLHYLRIREWQDLHQQLRSACKSARIDPEQSTAAQGGEPDWDTVHRALLAGLLSHVGVRDEQKREYAGARGSRFGINPGSGLFKKQPDVVMAAELVETTRLWARVNAAIDPVWAEEIGAHVVKRTFSEPRWSKSQGSVIASERVTLYGVPLIVDRTVQYGRINQEEARDLFIRNALVEGDWDTHHAFWKANTALLQRLSELEERARRRDLIVDDEVVFEFYDARIPPDVTSVRHFDRWWRGEQRRRPDLLTFTEELLTREDADTVSAGDYPRTWRQGDLELDVTYQFSPGDAADGATVHVPTAVLNRVDTAGFDWQVPGLREDLAVALLKSLPKATRRHFVPTPDHARAALAAADPTSGAAFTDELARVLRERTGVSIPPAEWDWARVPDHLRLTFSVEAPGGRVVARGKDLDELRPKSQGAVRQRMAKAGASIERRGLTAWTIDDVPRTFEGRSAGHTVQGFPALVDEGSSVALRVLDHPGTAAAAHRQGVRRLLLLNTTAPWKRVLARLSNAQKLALGQNPHGSVPALLEDCLAAAVDAIVAEHVAGEVRTRSEFETAHAAVRTHVVTRVLLTIEAVEPVLALAGDVRRRLDAIESGATARSLAVTTADVRAQLDGLVRAGFVADSGLARMPHLQRYLKAMLQRLDKAATNPREAQLQQQVDSIETAYADLLDALPPSGARAPEVTEIGWMIEELRVSLFAQSLGTAHPVSEKRVRNAIAAVTP